jgi:hypothetical protein
MRSSIPTFVCLAHMRPRKTVDIINHGYLRRMALLMAPYCADTLSMHKNLP